MRQPGRASCSHCQHRQQIVSQPRTQTELLLLPLYQLLLQVLRSSLSLRLLLTKQALKHRTKKPPRCSAQTPLQQAS
eukprot:COSAG02_NODE_28506_length_588_cov_0.865031_2_plen_76_part_01